MNALAVSTRRHAHQGQRGVATLIVVLVLFFVVSLVAAYTNRNLIFEQRTASNQYRSTQALEAAEAGLEWAISMLNLGRVTDTCEVSTNTADAPFRQRYLVIDGTGRITPKDNGSGGALSAACVFNGSSWTCSCPPTAEGTVTSPGSTGLFPAFRVRFKPILGAAFQATLPPRQPGVVQVEVVGCTRPDSASGEVCLNFDGQGALSEGRAVISNLVAITGGASSPPLAALTARGRVDIGGGTGFSAYNTVAGGSGITVHAGGTISGDINKIVSLPGTPGGAASFVPNDSNAVGDKGFNFNAAAGASGVGISTVDRMFAAVFNMRPNTFQEQPAALVQECGGGSCSIADVRDLAALNPWRPIWVKGDLVVDSSGDVGTVSEPVLLVVNGDLLFPTSGVTINGMVYIRTKTGTTEWGTSGSGTITGAAVSDADVRGDGSPTFVYDPAVIGRLRWSTGSFIRVPGSWKDFQP